MKKLIISIVICLVITPATFGQDQVESETKAKITDLRYLKTKPTTTKPLLYDIEMSLTRVKFWVRSYGVAQQILFICIDGQSMEITNIQTSNGASSVYSDEDLHSSNTSDERHKDRYYGHISLKHDFSSKKIRYYVFIAAESFGTMEIKKGDKYNKASLQKLKNALPSYKVNGEDCLLGHITVFAFEPHYMLSVKELKVLRGDNSVVKKADRSVKKQAKKTQKKKKPKQASKTTTTKNSSSSSSSSINFGVGYK